MRRIVIGLVGVIGVVGLAAQQKAIRSRRACPGTYIPKSELDAYRRQGDRRETDRSTDARATRHRQGARRHRVVHRGSLDAPPESVAEHDLVSEVLHHRRVGDAGHQPRHRRRRRPATLETVRLFNGPGNNGSDVRNGVAHELKAGDVIVIPAGTGHWFTKIPDHINYLMVRIDPDKVTPLRGEAESKAYLAKPHQQ
jgi:hypothetical protein